MNRRLLVVLLTAVLGLTAVAAVPGDSSERGPATGVTLDGNSLDWGTLVRLLHAGPVSVRLAPQARTEMSRTREGGLRTVAAGKRVYGWNQALGPLKDRPLTESEQREFQKHVLRSHAAGSGPMLSDKVARLALILRANAMARAHMGVRPELVDRMLAMVNADVIPRMPEVGSLGTGDLQPMAAAGLSMMGESNPVDYRGTQRDPDSALRAAGLSEHFTPQAGEALALISGGSVLLARYVDALDRAERVADSFDGAFALFLEATRAEQGAFDPRTHEERGFGAETESARVTRALTCSSEWMTERGRQRSGEAEPRVQDATSVRAEPQIIGGLRQRITEGRSLAGREANSSSSNPLLFKGAKGYDFVMGGNWDYSQLGHEIDALNEQIADLAVLSETLSGRLLDPKWSYGLPANLAGGKVGLNSGMVQAESMAASLIPEIQVRANPAGTLSRPVKGGQEDHNTMAMASARDLLANLDRTETVLGVQLMMGAQGIDLMRPKMGKLRLGSGSERVWRTVRTRIAPLTEDRYLSPDVRAASSLIHDDSIAGTVRSASAHGSNSCAA
ncbi:HAL/PAL/TAL family ammonia-lyase [Sciscionella sediminilitoris]|uniref:HAL/PAL/TAL family ammonia-lyase n=1 Tax=Sciscionella sediminilitoris TaxID=1445613 RepID=UPI0004DF1163|nr:aromatic amino acid ammonia-lyase [Sciscionella sp. SE31]